MDIDKLFQIVKQMAEINRFSSTSQRLLRYIKSYLNENNQRLKKQDERLIKEFVSSIFMNSIDDESKKELYKLNALIFEKQYYVEHNSPHWFTTSYGAEKYKDVDDEVILECFIPRLYKEGFTISDDSSLEEKEFISSNKEDLDKLSEYMDEREEIITLTYKTKKDISRDFTESLIDFLGYKRIGDIITFEDRQRMIKK